MNQVTILFQTLHPNAVVPNQGSPDAAGFDLTSISAVIVKDRVIVSTGLAVAFPDDHVLLIYGRSGLAFKHGIRLTNGVGVIDSDYRGEIKLSFSFDDSTPERMFDMLTRGQRVGQAILQPIPKVWWSAASALPTSIRGQAGFGSTG